MAGAVTGFGGLADSGECYAAWLQGMSKLETIRDNVASDSVDFERYVEERAKYTMEMMHVMGKMFEQEQLRTVHMITTMSRSGESGGGQSQNTRPWKEKASWSTRSSTT